MTGYLKVVKEDEFQQALYYLVIPNKELSLVYRQEIITIWWKIWEWKSCAICGGGWQNEKAVVRKFRTTAFVMYEVPREMG